MEGPPICKMGDTRDQGPLRLLFIDGGLPLPFPLFCFRMVSVIAVGPGARWRDALWPLDLLGLPR